MKTNPVPHDKGAVERARVSSNPTLTILNLGAIGILDQIVLWVFVGLFVFWCGEVVVLFIVGYLSASLVFPN